MHEQESHTTRRQFLATVGGTAAAGMLLSACGIQLHSTSSGQLAAALAPTAQETGPRFAGAPLPTSVPTSGPQPDLASDTGIDAGFLSFPKSLVASVPSPPGKSAAITVLSFTTFPTPPPLDQNAQWQALNTQLGTKLDLNVVNVSDYLTKLSTTMAGGELPDMLYYNQYSPVAVPHLPDFLKSKCADLTPYLAGDAVKDFPNLATFPATAWRATISNRGIYAVPVPRAPYLNAMEVRQDLVEAAGANSRPQNGDEFKALLKAATKPDANQYGIVGYGGTGFNLVYFMQIFGAPNNWSVDANGKFTKDYETDAFKAAVAFQKDLWSEGLFHPDSLNYNYNRAGFDILAGRFVCDSLSWGAFPLAWDRSAVMNPMPRWSIMPPFSANGGKPIYYLGPGSYGATALKQASPDRIREILGVLNFLAAPFGTREQLLNYFGVQDVDFVWDANGNPVPNDKGRADLTLPLRYVTSYVPVLYDANDPEGWARLTQDAEKSMYAVGIADPTIGLTSDSFFQKGVTLQTTLLAGVDNIVSRGGNLADIDQLVNDWRGNGGDQMRKEFEADYARVAAS